MTRKSWYRVCSAILIASWLPGLVTPGAANAAPVLGAIGGIQSATTTFSPQTITPFVSSPFYPADTTGMRPVPASKPYQETKAGPVEAPGMLDLPKSRLSSTTGGDDALQSKAGALNMPTPIVNFEGVNNLDGVYPPDTDGEVGRSQYVQMVNMHMAVYTKQGTLLYGPFTPNSLWPAGDVCRNPSDGDPVALYDQLADRWLISQFALPNYPNGPYYECIGISKGPIPTNIPSDWWLYTILASNTKMNDYPKLSIWPDGYYMTANQFTNGSSWGGAGVWAIERDKMLLGQPTRTVYFDLYGANPNFGGMLPVDLDGSTLSPAGSPAYFVEVDDSTWGVATFDVLSIWEFHVDWTAPANSTFGVNGQPNAQLATANFNPVCIGTRSCVPQPGTGVKLDGIGDRLMFRAAYRNFGGYEAFVVNHTVKADSTGRTGLRWYEVRDPGGTPSIYQQGTFAPNDGEWRWMASMAQDQAGNIGLGYSIASSSTYPSIRYTGRLASDPLGTMPQGEASVIGGSGSQTGTGSRWGDYSAMSVDPVNDCTFWYTQEYIQTTGGAPWQTRVASFKFPNCSAGPEGTLSGTITDGTNPIKDIIVHASASVTQTASTVTDINGNYTLSLPVGIYEVTASAYGYLPKTTAGVIVAENASTDLDFVLDKAPTYTVSGHVTDALTDWPLYAKITMNGYPGAPLWTDPVTGAYSIDLVGGIDYTFHTQAFSQGYTEATELIPALSTSLIKDFGLAVDPVACSAPGYTLEVTSVLTETFNATTSPAGWTDRQQPGQWPGMGIQQSWRPAEPDRWHR